MSNSSIWPIDRTLSDATTQGQNGPGSNGNEGVLCLPQSSSITEASPLDCLVSYLEHLLGESAEMQLVYSSGPVDWAMSIKSYTTLPKSSELKPHHQMHFSVIFGTPLLEGGVLLLYSQHILSPTDKER